MDKLIKRILHGELRLATIYWLYFVFVGAALQFTLMIFNHLAQSGEYDADVYNIVQCTTLIPYYSVVGIGVWRSANNYAKQRTSLYGVWSLLAKFAVLLNALSLLALVVTTIRNLS